jgi:hypothetical protein
LQTLVIKYKSGEEKEAAKRKIVVVVVVWSKHEGVTREGKSKASRKMIRSICYFRMR